MISTSPTASAGQRTDTSAQTKATMPGENAQLVRRGYAAFNAADMETLTKIFDENASWHTPGRSSLAGDRKGLDAVFAQFGRYGGETKGSFKAELLDVFESAEGRVVGVHHNTGERNGKRLDVFCCIAFEFKNGRCISGREYFFDLYAWDEFWS